MPEHFHLLITEPEVGDPPMVMKVIKERFSKTANEWGTPASQETERIWEKRFYDFNVWSAQKQTEKVKYLRVPHSPP